LPHRPDAPAVDLLVEDARLERRPLVGHDRRGAHADDTEVILGLSLEVFLPPGLPDVRLWGEVDPRLRAVSARAPGALPVPHRAVPGELGRVLAEVPDVPGAVLRVVVARPLLEPAGLVEPVGDDRARRALD